MLGATVLIVCLTVSFFGAVPGLAALLLEGLVTRLATAFSHHFFGGITGDTLGATNELVELTFVLLMLLFMS